jgi:hypothetical protein
MTTRTSWARHPAWAVGAGALSVAACVSDPVTADRDPSEPTDTSDDGIIIAPGKPNKPNPPKTTPIEVVKQNPVLDVTYPDAQFIYEPPPPQEACARSEFVAEPLPVDLYIMLDRSGSMNIPMSLPPTIEGDCDVGDPTVSRWCYTLNALDGFFTSGNVEETGVALQFFPNGNCSDTGPIGHDCCESGACCLGTADAIPAVELGPLVTNRDELVRALNEQSPAGVTTPIEAALRGIVTWTAKNKTSLRSMAGVLITDGEPTGCSNDAGLLSGLVATHLADTGIPTFVLGMDGAKFAPRTNRQGGRRGSPHRLLSVGDTAVPRVQRRKRRPERVHSGTGADQGCGGSVPFRHAHDELWRRRPRAPRRGLSA